MTPLNRTIAGVITRHRYLWRDELELHDGIVEVLAAAGLTVQREVPVAPRCRIDLLVHRIGVEIKVDGAAENVARQLQRYAHSPLIDGLVLATTRARHRSMPEHIGGKPLTVAYLTHLA